MRSGVCLFVIFCFSSFAGLKAQDGLDKYQTLADDFYIKGNYSSAIEVYERLLFFGNDQRSRQIYLPLARAYTAIGKFEKASVYYNNAYNTQAVDTIRYEIIFESAINYIRDNDTTLAFSELLNIPQTGISNRISNKLHLLTGTLDYKSGRYTGAKTHFLSITTVDSKDSAAIHSFFKKTRKIDRRYNPVMVEWMSIIPGLGQAWCGYYEESANAFILTGTLTLLYFHVSSQYRVLDGILTVFPWLNRYYKGGILKSYKLATIKRETEKNKLYNSLLKTLPPIN